MHRIEHKNIAKFDEYFERKTVAVPLIKRQKKKKLLEPTGSAQKLGKIFQLHNLTEIGGHDGEYSKVANEAQT